MLYFELPGRIKSGILDKTFCIIVVIIKDTNKINNHTKGEFNSGKKFTRFTARRFTKFLYRKSVKCKKETLGCKLYANLMMSDFPLGKIIYTMRSSLTINKCL